MRGEASALLSGCWGNTVLGVKNHAGLCPNCKYRAGLASGSLISSASKTSTTLLARRIVAEAQAEVSSLKSNESVQSNGGVQRSGDDWVQIEMPVQVHILITPPTPTNLSFNPLTFPEHSSSHVNLNSHSDSAINDLLRIPVLQKDKIVEGLPDMAKRKLRYGRWFAWRGYK